MIAAIEYDVTRFIMKAQIRQNLERQQLNKAPREQDQMDHATYKQDYKTLKG